MQFPKIFFNPRLPAYYAGRCRFKPTSPLLFILSIKIIQSLNIGNVFNTFIDLTLFEKKSGSNLLHAEKIFSNTFSLHLLLSRHFLYTQTGAQAVYFLE